MSDSLPANPAGRPNWANRTIFEGDNLDVLRGMNTAAVTLAYLDPPFNSNQTYRAPVGSKAAGAAFRDSWTLSDVREAEHGLLADANPAAYELIRAAGIVHGQPMRAYLTMMAVRLVELRRVLRPAGSVYLHCDDAAGAWLRCLMDAIFGAAWHRNTIHWRRTSAHSDARGRFGRVSDSILFYAGPGAPWNTPYEAHDPRYLANPKHRVENPKFGPCTLSDPTGPGLSDGESGRPWRGVNPGASGRCWSVPKTGSLARWIESAGVVPGYQSIAGVHARLDALDAAGLIHWRSTGAPRLLRPLAANPGRVVVDSWTDIDVITSGANERVGYPTQKPLALLDRIIRASSNTGDVVLDPFAGCATTCVAAERAGRQWAGIDLSPLAFTLVADRLKRERKTLDLMPDLERRTDVPVRTDTGPVPDYRTHRNTLYGRQAGDCAGCRVHFEIRNLTVDHVIPQSKGGGDHLDNLQLLCGACNSMKGTGTQVALLAKLKARGFLATDRN